MTFCPDLTLRMCRSGVGWVSVMYRLCVGGESVGCQSGVGRESDVRKECVGQVSVVYFTSLTRWGVNRVKRMWSMHWLGVGQVSVMCRSGVGWVPVVRKNWRPTVSVVYLENRPTFLEVSSLLYKQARIYYVTSSYSILI